jgi:hypothetical protein
MTIPTRTKALNLAKELPSNCPRDSSGHDMHFRSWKLGGHDGDYKKLWSCDKCRKKSKDMDPEFAAGRYCCVVCKSDICISCFVVNKAGIPMELGKKEKSNFYCSRSVDGVQCGPASGPQCVHCSGYTKTNLPPRISEPYRQRWGFEFECCNQPIVPESPSTTPIVIESAHPYPDKAREFKAVEISGALGYSIVFSADSKTEHRNDFVRFYKDDSHSEFWGESKYSGGVGATPHNFPGVGGNPPLIIPSTKFVFHFYSNEHTNDWGYCVTISPQTDDIAASESIKKITALSRFHKSLLSLGEQDTYTRSIDESLILYLETEKKDIVNSADKLQV